MALKSTRDAAIADPRWIVPPEHLYLNEGEAHVWIAPTEVASSGIENLHRVLPPEEQNRAGRFFRTQDRTRFAVAHAVLRIILGQYLRKPPETLRFSTDRNGKPALIEHPHPSPLRFNLSHSNSYALIGVACNREVGVDIECRRDDIALMEIAERYFSSREVQTLRSCPPSNRVEAFFNCWTRKEAYLKARGEGLGFPLDQFSVSLAPGDPAVLLHTAAGPLECERWSLFDLPVGSGQSAALAIAGECSLIRCWRCLD